jgi:hypothetical protein
MRYAAALLETYERGEFAQTSLFEDLFATFARTLRAATDHATIVPPQHPIARADHMLKRKELEVEQDSAMFELLMEANNVT